MRQAWVLEVKVPAELIETAPYTPNQVIDYFDGEKEAAFGRLYGIIQLLMGLDDEIDEIIIKGRNDVGKKYDFRILYER